jgi:hypothetical protein
MFFVRAAFFIFLILLLMPSSDKEKSDFYIAAGRTISDLGGFCDRNPDVCERTGAIVEGIIRKVRNTVHMIEEAIGDGEPQDGPDYGPRDRSGGPRQQRGAAVNMMIAPAVNDSQNTLRPDDLAPQWRGPGGV